MIRKKKADTKPKSFDRAARDALRRVPVPVLEAEARCMLVKDDIGRAAAVDPSNMRLVMSVRSGNLGPIKKYGPKVTLPLQRLS